VVKQINLKSKISMESNSDISQLLLIHLHPQHIMMIVTKKNNLPLVC